MSIRKKQVIRTTEDIISGELKRGVYPRPRDVLRRLHGHIRRHGLGKPTMHPRFAERRHKANTHAHNQMIDQVYYDLETLYAEYIDQTGQVNTNFLQYDIHAKRLEYEIDHTASELRQLLLVSDNTNYYIHVVGDEFNDLSKVDMVNTTAHIEDGTVSNSTHGITTTIELGPGEIEFEARNITGIVRSYPVAGSSIMHMVDGRMDTAWQFNIEANQQGTYGCLIHVKPNSPITTNRIQLRMHTIKPIIIGVRYSPDNGINWFTLDTYKTDLVYNMDFSHLTFTDLELSLSKSEPDYHHQSDNLHVYNFGISELSIFTSGYTNRSILQSIDFDISEVGEADSVALWTEEIMPAGTNISYQVKVNDHWTHISPLNRESPRHPITIPFGAVAAADPVTLEMSEDLPPPEYEVVKYYVHNTRFYTIGNLDLDIIGGSITLYKGLNMWKLTTYEGDLISDQVQDLTEILAEHDPTSTEYTPIIQERPGLLPGITAGDLATRRHSLLLLADTPQTIANTNPMCNAPISIYLNKRLIYHGTPRPGDYVTYNLRQGANYLDVLVYAAEGTSISPDVALDLSRFKGKTYGHQYPLEQVSISELRYSSPGQNLYKFAVVEIDQQLAVIINHIASGVPFQATYKYRTEMMHTIALRATLRRDTNQTDTTARLLSYQLRLS